METKRVVSPGAEQWLSVEHRVLNSGLVELVDYMGTEEQMVGIARISHGKILPHTIIKDAQRLINYFMEHRHTSPFEFIETTWRWRLPIFSARQVIRHRTAGVNEKSARYSELDAEIYIPDSERIQAQDNKNRQGSAGELPLEVRKSFLEDLQTIQSLSKQFYGKALKNGVAKELARTILPLGVYTDWVWKMDLHNLFHFLGLRLDNHAQYETRVYAEAIYSVLKDAFPMCCNAFEEYRLFSKTFAASEVAVLKAMSTQFKENYPEQSQDPMFNKILEKILA